MSASFDAERANAVRALLIETAAPTRRRRGLVTAALVMAGALGGAALSTAALAATGQLTVATPSGEPTPTLPDAVEAPAGTLPGSPVAVLLGTAAVLTVTEATTYSLADRPEGTTHVRVTVTAQSPGWLYWGTNPGQDNPSGSWAADDVAAGQASWYDFPLDSSTDTLYLTPLSGWTGAVSIQFITLVPTHLAVNANGQTYGVDGGPDGAPDLTSVWATAPDGSMVQGYVRTEDLNAFSPAHPGQPTNPEQALKWQDERAQDYPNGWDLPAYEHDGVTQVGVFHVG